MKSRAALIWISKMAKHQLFLLILLSLTNIITSTSYIGLALISRKAINLATSGAEFSIIKSQLLFCGILLLAVVLIQLLLTVFNSHLKAVISGRFESELRYSLFENIITKKYPEIKKFHSGELINRFTSDIDTVVGGVTNFLPQAVSIIAKILSGLIVIATFSKSFTLVVVGVGITVTLLSAIISPIFKRLHKAVQEASGVMRSFSQECIENIVVVKSFSSKAPLLRKLNDYLKKVYKTKIKRNHISNVSHGGLFFVFNAGYYATLAWGIFEIASGSMDYGTLMAFMQIISNIRAPFYSASGLITHLYSALASAERLMELEELNTEQSRNDVNVQALYDSFSCIKAENLQFSYDDDIIIKDSSFTINKGDIVSITGVSGGGKSTLFRLLLGLYEPNSGSLKLITETNESQINASTRPLFAYVPQGNFILSGTVAENIKFGSQNVSDEDMLNAAKIACIDDIIESLPNKYDTVLGERGLGLSEGQLQRIAIARAILSNAPILLLDECTSALDETTEQKLVNNIAQLHQKTVLFISHRNSSLKICDKHLRFEDNVIHSI